MLGQHIDFHRIAEIWLNGKAMRCRLEDGTTTELPGILIRFLHCKDRVEFLGAATEILIQRSADKRQLPHVDIGYVGLPKPGKSGDALIRADLRRCQKVKALFLSVDAVRRYFYLLDKG